MNSHRNSAARTGCAMAAGLAMAVVSLAAPQAAVAAGKAPSIEGVWTSTNVVVTGANAMTNTSPQPSLYIFSHGHYVYVADTSPTPRTAAPVKDSASPTDAEKVAKFQEWSPVIAQGGTYQVKGKTLIRQAIVAKNVAAIGTGGRSESEIKLTGDTLLMINRSAAGQPVREQRVTLTRVK
jgi:hypothetical protein